MRPRTVPASAVHSQIGGHASKTYRATSSTHNAANHPNVPR